MKRKILKKKYKALCKLILGGMAFLSSMFINQNDLKALPIVDSTNTKTNITNINTNDKTMTINGNNKGNGFIAWRDFSIGRGETVNFYGMTNMLNYVTRVNPSLIYGTINALGVNNFYIINPSGILFGKDSMVRTNHLFVSTRSLTDSQIQSYINGGNNYDIFANSTPLINEGGLKSADILGPYDIADGDVMFLGKVQANSLKVEGNTIQIRNTANIRKLTNDNNNANSSDGETATSANVIAWNDNTAEADLPPILTDVTLISDNHPEVGYVVSTDGVTSVLQNPFTFNSTMSEDEIILKLAQYYGIYLRYTYDNDGNVTGINKEVLASDNEFYNNYVVSNANYEALRQLYTFFNNQVNVNDYVDADGNGTLNENDRILIAVALDTVIKNSLSTSSTQIRTYDSSIGVADQFVWTDATAFTFDNTTKFNTAANSAYSTALTNVRNSYNTYTSGNTYKYFVADSVESNGGHMPNSANALQWSAKKLDGSTTQTIDDYRLIQNPFDFNLANHSKWTKDNQLNPTEGTIHGNYMLDGDIDFTASPYNITSFKPLGYNMDFTDFASESDMINFNGLNFKISNLTTDNTASTSQGLFSIFSGTVKNLRFQNVNVGTSTTENAGTFAGEVANYGGVGVIEGGFTLLEANSAKLDTTIKNVSVLSPDSGTNTVTGNNAGGLVGNLGHGDYLGSILISDRYLVWATAYQYENGYSEQKITKEFSTASGAENFAKQLRQQYDDVYILTYDMYAIPNYPVLKFDNIENFASVSGKSNAGGLLGYVAQGGFSTTNAINNGTVRASSGNAGGITGFADNCYAIYASNDTQKSISLQRVYNTGAISGTNYIGGLIGRVNNKYTSNITQSWNEGPVSATSSTSHYLGGLVGQLSGTNATIDQVFNSGTVTGKNYSGTNYTGGLMGVFDVEGGSLTNSYNSGKVSGGESYRRSSYNYAGGLIGEWESGNIENVYNSGNVSGTYVGGLIGYFYNYYNNQKLSNAYNIGDVMTTYLLYKDYAGGIVGNSSTNKMELTNVYNSGKLYNDYYSNEPFYDKIFASASTKKVTDITSNNVNSAQDANVSEIWNFWKDNNNSSIIDSTGGNSNAVWRVYANPTDPTDKARQPLLSAFLNEATVQRYTEIDTAGKIDPITDIVSTSSPNMHGLHDSDGYVLDVRYKNTGKSTIIRDANGNAQYFSGAELTSSDSDNGKRYYYVLNPNLFNVDFTNGDTAESGYFAVSSDKKLSKGLFYSSQFGYNFTFDNTAWTADSNEDSATQSARNSPTANAAYLKLSTTKTTLPESQPPQPVDNLPPTTNPTPQAVTVDITVTASGGQYNKVDSTMTYDDGSTGIHYTVSNPSGASLDGFTFTYNDQATEIKNDDGTTNYYTTMVAVTYSGTTYSLENGNLTQNNNGTYSFTQAIGTTTYNFTINPGKITSTNTLNVTIDVGDITKTNGTLSETGSYSSNNTTINNLISNIFNVVEGTNGTTTLAFKDSSITGTTSGNITTYTVSEKTFTKDNTTGVFTYTDDTNSNNIVTYNVTLNPGTVTNVLDKNVTIDVNNGAITDGVFSVITSGDSDKGYTISATDFSNNADSVAATTISGLLGTLNVVQSDNNTTTVNLRTSEHLTSNADGTYTYTSTVGNTTTNYKITVTPGSISDYINVTINVNNGQYSSSSGLTVTAIDGKTYTITSAVNDDIITLLSSVLKVVDENSGHSKTTVTFDTGSGLTFSTEGNTTTVIKDGQTYTITKTGNYTYQYNDATNNTYYNVTVVPGTITTLTPTPTPTPAPTPTPTPAPTPTPTPTPSPTVTNIPVNINVTSRTETDGTLDPITGDGYTVDNDVIRGLLTGKVRVVEKDGVVTLVFSDGSSANTGTNTYSGYTFTKNTDGTYTYSVTDSSGNITNYNVTLNNGALTKYTNKNATINVNNGEYSTSSGLSVIQTDGKTYSVTGDNAIITLLGSDVLKVIDEGNGHTKTTVTFNTDSGLTVTTNGSKYTVTKAGKTYEITKTGDYTFTYVDKTDTSNQIIYHVTVVPGTITTSTPTPTPTPTPVSVFEPTQIQPVTSTLEPLSTPTITTDPVEEINEPDVDLRSSNIATFPEEKGDYVDLDLLDRTLMEVTNPNEAVDNLDIVPEEFNQASARNIVNNQIELTSINDTPNALNTEINNSNSLNTENNDSASSPSSTLTNNDQNSQEITSENEAASTPTNNDQNSQETTSENESDEEEQSLDSEENQN